MASCLVIEPFYGGSHAQMIDLVIGEFGDALEVYKLPGNKWPWRARTSALYVAQNVPYGRAYRVLFCSSVLNLAELVALRPDITSARKVIYFHENQLVYPVQKSELLDFQFSYAQIISCLVADRVVFNSAYNMNSFLSSIDSLLRLIPKEGRPSDVASRIQPKCSVLYFPVLYPPRNRLSKSVQCLHIIWPHRWEHDKNPDLLFSVLRQLKSAGLKFTLSVLGEAYKQQPDCFRTAFHDLRESVIKWGFLEDKNAYYEALCAANVVVSTAHHEFFGVAMLEATYLGCYPLCPDKLVYREIYPADCRYRTAAQLCKRLRAFCKNPALAVSKRASLNIDFSKYSWDSLKASYRELFGISSSESVQDDTLSKLRHS